MTLSPQCQPIQNAINLLSNERADLQAQLHDADTGNKAALANQIKVINHHIDEKKSQLTACSNKFPPLPSPSSLYAISLECVTETPGSGSDDIYTVVFVGASSIAGGGELIVTPAWNGMDSGTTKAFNNLVELRYKPDALYLVALVEQDYAKDVAGADRAKLQSAMQTALKAHSASGTASLSDLAGHLVPEMKLELSKLLTNDDVIGVEWLRPLNSVGSSRSLHFVGAGANYVLRVARE